VILLDVQLPGISGLDLLDIERTNLHKKMRALGISRDDRQEPG
jgi:CheY-like chemotaxis protein